ncbi:hypothetical protein [Pontibacter chinhatensis]|uniref:Uncharacterized protein n=1 Tax=Pontibacter chinhatensis TaxID=1436961 RepID=A0A1I2S5P0_9BACT|nr:hypothetical protein [Pontibacter chinhatensis]SFG47049.1 hypothetical protein SAMN05421739_102627 [Pontibacter chinhatensis]
MKKIFLIALGAIAFACSDAADNRTTGSEDAAAGSTAVDENVEIGAGEEISPQLDLDSASNERLDVDTVSNDSMNDRQ